MKAVTVSIMFVICSGFAGMVHTSSFTHEKLAISYDSTRHIVASYRNALKWGKAGHRVNDDSIARAFTQIMMRQIFPYWYGTVWDFNGYTARPGEGTIACGYFVSTTLQHAGINVNRYKMAQKSSMDGALMLEPRDSLLIKRGSREQFLEGFRATCRNGLYMIGLSYHVGFIYKQGREVQFIHSSYLDPVCVVSENADSSEALGQSKIFVVADITYNRQLLNKWLTGEVLKH